MVTRNFSRRRVIPGLLSSTGGKWAQLETQKCLQAESGNCTGKKQRLPREYTRNATCILLALPQPKDRFNKMYNPPPIKVSKILIKMMTWVHRDYTLHRVSANSGSLCGHSAPSV